MLTTAAPYESVVQVASHWCRLVPRTAHTVGAGGEVGVRDHLHSAKAVGALAGNYLLIRFAIMTDGS